MSDAPAIERVRARAFEVPTDAPEADGTLSWKSTTALLVVAEGGGRHGLGLSYTGAAAKAIVNDTLAEVLIGESALSPPRAWDLMRGAVRNLGYPGIVSAAISALDIALWDLKARLLDVSLGNLLGPIRERVPVYGSGGFTSYDDGQLQRQLIGWAKEGMRMVKMKVGSHPHDDPRRVALAREAIGEQVELFVDGNGAYDRKQALRLAQVFAEQSQVSWFEEPVSSDDLEGLRLLRDRAPAGMQIAAGEYGYEPFYFRRMLDAGAVDVLQADVTRCGGITQMLAVDALCAAQPLPLSAHTSPTVHGSVGVALHRLVHVEYFHDHARIEQILLDGALAARDGTLQPDLGAPGLGIELRESDATRYEV